MSGRGVMTVRAAVLIKAGRAVTDLLLVLSVTMAGAALIVSGPGRFYSYSLLGTSVFVVVGVLGHRRTSRADQRIGQLDEQMYVGSSLVEAVDRGMTATEWFGAYTERVMADATSGRGKWRSRSAACHNEKGSQ